MGWLWVRWLRLDDGTITCGRQRALNPVCITSSPVFPATHQHQRPPSLIVELLVISLSPHQMRTARHPARPVTKLHGSKHSGLVATPWSRNAFGPFSVPALFCPYCKGTPITSTDSGCNTPDAGFQCGFNNDSDRRMGSRLLVLLRCASSSKTTPTQSRSGLPTT
jgi:hypothetical protein